MKTTTPTLLSRVHSITHKLLSTRRPCGNSSYPRIKLKRACTSLTVLGTSPTYTEARLSTCTLSLRWRRFRNSEGKSKWCRWSKMEWGTKRSFWRAAQICHLNPQLRRWQLTKMCASTTWSKVLTTLALMWTHKSWRSTKRDSESSGTWTCSLMSKYFVQLTLYRSTHEEVILKWKKAQAKLK